MYEAVVEDFDSWKGIIDFTVDGDAGKSGAEAGVALRLELPSHLVGPNISRYASGTTTWSVTHSDSNPNASER